MKKIKLKNLNKPTSAKMSKLGIALVSISAFISGYGVTSGKEVVGYVGLCMGIVGTFLVNMYND